MQRIIDFILRNKNTLLFALLFIISLFLTIQNNDFHRSRYFNSANWLSGSIYNTSTSVKEYFSLKEGYDKLLEENRRLKARLYNMPSMDSLSLDTFRSILTDHASGPYAICRHPEPSEPRLQQTATRASVMMDLAARTLHLALGQPCNNDYQTFTL